MRNNLITLIHQHTMKEHQITESLPFIQRYKDRQITLKQHYAHLEQLAAIYSILENHTLRSHVKLPKELRRRLAPLNKDIKQLRKHLTIHNDTEANLCPSTVDYCNHLSQLSSSNLLLAHCLVRYLGDLFGGKKVQTYIQETLPNAPINFYRFASSKNTVYNIKRQSFESSRKIMDAIKLS